MAKRGSGGGKTGPERTVRRGNDGAPLLERSVRSEAEPIARWLALCGWLRARGTGLRPGKVRLEGKVGDRLHAVLCTIPYPGGKREALGATGVAWRALRERCVPERITVVLDDLAPDPWQFVDLLEGSDSFDRPIDRAFADIRRRYGVRAIQCGITGDPTGPYTGLKIAFDRVPSLEEVDLFCGGSHG